MKAPTYDGRQLTSIPRAQSFYACVYILYIYSTKFHSQKPTAATTTQFEENNAAANNAVSPVVDFMRFRHTTRKSETRKIFVSKFVKVFAGCCFFCFARKYESNETVLNKICLNDLLQRSDVY